MSREKIHIKEGNVEVTYAYKFDEFENVEIRIYEASPEEHYQFKAMYLSDLIKLLQIIERERR